MINPFLWAAGAAEKDVADLPSERTKQAGIGALIFVPPVLGACGMGYAVSTVAPLHVAGLAALIWAAVVFAIDRFIVSSTRRIGGLQQKLISLPIRLAFSLLVATAIAHPLVTWFFRDALDQRLGDSLATNIHAAGAPLVQQIEAARTALDKLEDERRRLAQEAQQRRDLTSDEASGVKTQHTTGKYGRHIAWEERDRAAHAAEEILRRYEVDLPAHRKLQQDRIAALQQDIERKRQALTTGQDRGYIARAQALEELRAESSEVRGVYWLVIILFLFVDMLPLVLKISYAVGPYDHHLAFVEQRAISKITEQRDATDLAREFRVNRFVQEMISVERAMSHGNSLRNLNLFLRRLLEQYTSFDEQLAEFRNLIRKTSDDEERQRLQRMADLVVDLRTKAWEHDLETYAASFQTEGTRPSAEYAGRSA